MTHDDLSSTREISKMAKLEEELRRLIVAVDDRLSTDPSDQLRSFPEGQKKIFGTCLAEALPPNRSRHLALLLFSW